MAKKKPDKQDRHAKEFWRITLRLGPEMSSQLEKLISLMASDATHEIRTAIRERLERFDLWPPKPDHGK